VKDIVNSRVSDGMTASYYEHPENSGPPILPTLYHQMYTVTNAKIYHQSTILVVSR